jgi:hypothetical protein
MALIAEKVKAGLLSITKGSCKGIMLADSGDGGVVVAARSLGRNHRR